MNLTKADSGAETVRQAGARRQPLLFLVWATAVALYLAVVVLFFVALATLLLSRLHFGLKSPFSSPSCATISWTSTS